MNYDIYFIEMLGTNVNGGLGILRCPFFGVTKAIGGRGEPLSLVQYVLGYN
jgi:hypothetical protein